MQHQVQMKPIVFFDTEIKPESLKILDIGAIKHNGSILHSHSIEDFESFIKEEEYLCGHNVFMHDWKYISKKLKNETLRRVKLIDTLYLSPLLFPSKPYHRLVKDDKLLDTDLNNPVNDSKKAKDLFYDEISAFSALNKNLKEIFFQLLHFQMEFRYFFEYIDYTPEVTESIIILIKRRFKNNICANAPFEKIIKRFPKELAYSLALIGSEDKYSLTPPWVNKVHPEMERIMYLLRSKTCLQGCEYCNRNLDANDALKKYFGFDSYRTFDGKSLQEDVVNAVLKNKSILAIFPTGGGKSITFQVPALMEGENTKGLTVVISPLQSLMKDQVDNLEKYGITQAVTINGLLDPVERKESFGRVEEGTANILYISPESLRSHSIERLLLNRRIARFVIDEAHCLSSWGQDFRVDYLYIAEFIKSLQEKKNLSFSIPVSCFTATAKLKVIEDIKNYFYENLGLELELFKADITRPNLSYQVFESKEENDKYNKLRNLIDSHKCPTIIYVSRTRKAVLLAQHLNEDGFNAKPYHGKMDISLKKQNQEDFIAGKVDIMVATSAFGMGVDKKDVGMVIHYDISDSLENYVQEAGRAGRDESISAKCFVLYNEEDLNKHFILLNQTKITIKEIQQIWAAIKKITNFRNKISNSALEIAREAGWDDSVNELETRVKTAIAALEQAGYLKRGQNNPRIYANSILTKNAQEAIDKINISQRFTNKQKVKAIRIIKKLFSAKSRKNTDEEVAESRVDYISDHLGIVKEDVINIITLLREEKILADSKDLTAFISKQKEINKSLSIVKSYSQIEDFLLSHLSQNEKVLNIKEINEIALSKNIKNINPHKIKQILNYWAIKNWINKRNHYSSSNHISIVSKQDVAILNKKQKTRHELARFIVDYLYNKIDDVSIEQSQILVEFSVLELKEKYEKSNKLFKSKITIEDIENSLFYLSRIGAIKIEGGFLVIYNKLTIDRIEKNNKIRYKKEDYNQLENFYNSKRQQIHIVGEYARNMLEDYDKALRFVDDYFKLNYFSFLNKYFPGSRKDEIQRNITPKKFKELFGTLSPRQLDIIKDNKSQYILVAAGPGSGKTRVLVHKLASLLLMEDTKHEQLLMLTFSRAAATEFKKRLLKLIGYAANYVEIKTFHSYCFNLLGRIGTKEKSENIIRETIEKIQSGEVEQNKITKTVLVIDEAQDMDKNEFELVSTLMQKNEGMRVIAVGDDDQNIYTFRGADSRYFEKFLRQKDSKKYELLENYRSKNNLVNFTNKFVEKIQKRIKSNDIVAVSKENGTIELYYFKNSGFLMHLAESLVSKDLAGTTAVLTQTNDEALQISGVLNKMGIPAKLIQSDNEFNLYNLMEMRWFIDNINKNTDSPSIPKEVWNNAKRNFKNKYKRSTNFELCRQIIKDFEDTNPKSRYKSDFEMYVKESKIEDFVKVKGEIILVSTIHKAKGKEFDNIFLLLDDYNGNSDDEKRKVYVAITRAKSNLYLFTGNSIFNDFEVEEIYKYYIEKQNPLSDQIYVNLTHKDIYLNHFTFIQGHIDSLNSGDELKISEDGLSNKGNVKILKFSKAFKAKTLTSLNKQGYFLTGAKINYILYWQKDDTKEIKIVLPQLVFERTVQ